VRQLATTARGTSLLEVVIMLGLVATLSALAWQGRGLAARVALAAAARTLVADLRVAQARAIAERQSSRAHGIDFAGDRRRYVRFAREGGVRQAVEIRRLPYSVRVTHARFGGVPDEVFFTGNSLLGAPSGGGTVTLAAGGARLCVRLLPATGRVRIAKRECP
jgi:hypothetical protein